MQIDTLKKQNHFDYVNKHGVKVYCKYFLLVLKTQHTLDPSKTINTKHQNKNQILYGLKVSKKLSKLAVIRNKLKRRIKHLVRDYFSNNSHFGAQIIIIPKKNIQNVLFTKLEQDLHTNLSKHLPNTHCSKFN